MNTQWLFAHARRGLLPTFSERGAKSLVQNHFRHFRSFPGWWERVREAYDPEFVEWVEEQRSKAA